MITQAAPPRRRLPPRRLKPRHLKQNSQWRFRVGQYADERSHGNTTVDKKSTVLAWSIDDFNVIEEIGSGCFGTVSMAFDKRREGLVALKQVAMSVVLEKGSVSCLRNEVEIQTRYVCTSIDVIDSYHHSMTHIFQPSVYSRTTA